MKKLAALAGVAALAASPLLADFSYQETSTITGGAMLSMLKVVGVFSKQAREPIVSTVSAKGVPGYQEVRKFYQRMAEKLNWTPGGNMFMQNPQVAEGMAEVYKEMSKLDGVPVEQFITMGAAGQPAPDGSTPPQPPPQQQQ